MCSNVLAFTEFSMLIGMLECMQHNTDKSTHTMFLKAYQRSMSTFDGTGRASSTLHARNSLACKINITLHDASNKYTAFKKNYEYVNANTISKTMNKTRGTL